ncbi:MAG: LysR family transcriptional regulator [Colwellia sp.]
MNITIEQLRVLVSVNASGSFSRTAELLGQTPSAISRKISQLEKQLNIKLFTRTTRRISLTDEGRIITEKAHEALSVINDIQDNAALSHNIPQGKLKIDAPTPFLEHCIIPYLEGFMAKYPRIEIELASFDTQIDLIEKQVDIAFRIGQLRDSSLHYRPIGHSKLRILASPNYIERYGEPKTPSELSQHRCLGFSQPVNLNNWPLKHKEGKSFTLKPHLLFSSGSLLRQAAIGGMGIACLADFMTNRDVNEGGLIQVLSDATLERYQPINAVFYKPYQSSLKIKCFIDFISSSISSRLSN